MSTELTALAAVLRTTYTLTRADRERLAVLCEQAAAIAQQPAPVQECADNDSPWLVCKPCAAVGQCEKAAQAGPVQADAPDWLHLKAYGYAPGNYMAKCCVCERVVAGLDKRAISCRPCAEARHKARADAQPVAPTPRQPLTEEQRHKALGTAGPDLLALAKRWADNEIHVYQFTAAAERIVAAAIERGRGITQEGESAPNVIAQTRAN